jgi:hypothetical protein
VDLVFRAFAGRGRCYRITNERRETVATIMEICLEELSSTGEELDDRGGNDEPFIRCVALPGGDPGLALDRHGDVRWMPEGPAAYGLWTSADGRLVLLRGQGAGPVTVERGTRALEAPTEKPVMLVDGDILRVDGRGYRVHVHGETDVVYPPERLSRSAIRKLVGAAAAASLAFGGVAASPAASPANADQRAADAIEVRLHPPAPVPRKSLVRCSIKKQKATKKGLEIKATCTRAKGLNVGLWGKMVREKDGKDIPKGQVRIKAVSGKNVGAIAPQLSKPVKGARLEFWVRNY